MRGDDIGQPVANGGCFEEVCLGSSVRLIGFLSETVRLIPLDCNLVQRVRQVILGALQPGANPLDLGPPYLKVPDGTDLGVELDKKALARWRVA